MTAIAQQPASRAHPFGSARLPRDRTSPVQVVAHRGCPAPGRPENTVAAIVAALEGDGDGAELDVRLTVDGALICSHDAELSRLGGPRLTVADSTAADLRRVRLPGGHSPATLDEVLAAATRHVPCRLVIEAKQARDGRTALRTAHALREALAARAASLDVTVSSFDPALLGSIRQALVHAAVGTALLGSAPTPVFDLLREAVQEGHDQIHPHFLSVLKDPDVIGIAHSLGIEVTCWTVNRRRHLSALARLGIDGVITDDARAARAALAAIAAIAATPAAACA